MRRSDTFFANEKSYEYHQGSRWIFIIRVTQQIRGDELERNNTVGGQRVEQHEQRTTPSKGTRDSAPRPSGQRDSPAAVVRAMKLHLSGIIATGIVASHSVAAQDTKLCPVATTVCGDFDWAVPCW
jgi:hypothetical protein